jgi:hypothetical protein
MAADVRNLQIRTVQIKCENCIYMMAAYREFDSLVMTSAGVKLGT